MCKASKSLAMGLALLCLGAPQAWSEEMALPKVIAAVSARHDSIEQAFFCHFPVDTRQAPECDWPMAPPLFAPASHGEAQAPMLVKQGPPPVSGKNILEAVPRVGAFDLTFYSDVPAGGYDAMFTAFAVVSLTRHF